MVNPGKTFDNSQFMISEKEVKKFISSVFTEKELKGKTILDAGCRLGEYSKELAKKAKSVTGIDISQESIKFAKKSSNEDNLRFEYGDITNIKQFKNNSFDIVFCIGSMPYLKKEQIKQALVEFERITNNNGIIILTFQKEKGAIGNIARFTANILPLKLWLFIAKTFSPILAPLASLLLKRKISKEYLIYGIFLSLRGVNFGISKEFQDKYSKFRIKTPECLNYSEETTATFKIKNNK